MKRLLLSFLFTLLTAQQAHAIADHSKADHAVNLIELFEADKVDAVINSKVGNVACGEGVNLPTENEIEQKESGATFGRAPAIVTNADFHLAQFKKSVEKGEFRETFYKEGDIYSYSSESLKPIQADLPFGMQVLTTEHVFNRKSKTKDKPFEHERGLTEEAVRKYLLTLMEDATQYIKTNDKSYSFVVDGKFYHINLEYPLLANPIYKQDVKTIEIDYGFANVTSRTEEFEMPFVSMTK